jgi:hypothetical protein
MRSFKIPDDKARDFWWSLMRRVGHTTPDEDNPDPWPPNGKAYIKAWVRFVKAVLADQGQESLRAPWADTGVDRAERLPRDMPLYLGQGSRCFVQTEKVHRRLDHAFSVLSGEMQTARTDDSLLSLEDVVRDIAYTLLGGDVEVAFVRRSELVGGDVEAAHGRPTDSYTVVDDSIVDDSIYDFDFDEL